MSNTSSSVTSVLTNNDTGKKNVIKMVGLPAKDANYSALTGIFPRNFETIGEMVQSESEIAYDRFYGNDAGKYTVDNYVETVDIDDNEELKNIIQKIRSFIETNKAPFAAEFIAKYPGIFASTVFKDDLNKDPDKLDLTKHIYENFADDAKARETMEGVNKCAECVFAVLSNEKYVSKSVTFDRSTDVPTIDELNVLIPKYYESFVYIVGQGFNVFSPTSSDMSFFKTFDKLLAELPKSLIFSFGNRDEMVKSFFESKPVSGLLSSFAKDGKKEGNSGYYVGGLDADKKKQGAGVMRWNNKNVFEGTFANDAIIEGDFRTFDAGTGTGAGTGAPQKLIMTDSNTGAATLNGVAGIFDSVGGEFGLSSTIVSAIPTAASPSASTSSSTSASPPSSASASTSASPLPVVPSSTIIAIPTSTSSSSSSSTIISIPTSSSSTIIAVPKP